MLKRWLEANEISPEVFARTLKCSVYAVLKWQEGSRMPNKIMRSKILKITDGEVTPNDLHQAMVERG